jgi:hypothetical protein
MKINFDAKMICFSETNLTKDKVRFPIIVSLNVKLTQFSDCA